MRKNCITCLELREYGETTLQCCGKDVFGDTMIKRKGNRFYLMTQIEHITTSAIQILGVDMVKINFCPICGRKLTRRMR